MERGEIKTKEEGGSKLYKVPSLSPPPVAPQRTRKKVTCQKDEKINLFFSTVTIQPHSKGETKI